MKLVLISLAFIVGFAMCNSKDREADTVVKDDKAVQEKNKNIVRTAINEVINKRNLAAFDQYFDPKVVDHAAWEDQAPGVEGIKKAVGGLLADFSELQVIVNSMITAGNMVATQESWKGTHAATKKLVTGQTMHMFRLKDGRITDTWSNGWEWLEGL